MAKEIKRVTLGNVNFCLEDLIKDSKTYLKLIRLHTKPEVFVRRENETKDKYFKRLFNNLYRKGFGTNDVPAEIVSISNTESTAAPMEEPVEESVEECAKEIAITVSKTPAVLCNEVLTLADAVIKRVDDICKVRLYDSNDSSANILLWYLEELRSKATAISHVATNMNPQ